MRAGKLNKPVTLGNKPTVTNDADGFYEALSPESVMAAIVPSGASDERTTTHAVTIRYHPQVSVDTRVLYFDPVKNRNRELFVRQVVNVNEQNAELRLLCEEIEP